jgi:hypothetical protein
MSTPRKATMKSVQVPVHVKAAAGEDGPPTFEAVAYSGGLIPGYTATPRFDHDYVIDLSGMTQGRGPKVNLSHDSEKRVGHETSFANSGKELVVTGVLSAVTPHQEEVATSASRGYPWEVSQEAQLYKIRKLSAGKTATVNGQEFTGPLYIVGQSVHTALAFVSQGADEGNSVSVAATAAGANAMTEFETWLAANDFDHETMTEKQKAKMQAAYDSEKGGTKTAVKPSKISDLAAAEIAEDEREAAITSMTHKAVKEFRHNKALAEAIAEMGNRAIADKLEPEKFELELLRGTRLQAGAIRVTQRTEPDGRVMEAALARAAGLPNIEKHYSAEVLDSVDRNPKLRNFSLQQAIMQAACANGYDGQPGERITTSTLKRVLKYAFPDTDGPGAMMHASGLSTISLPGILGTVANKEILAGFTEEDQSWREISAIKPVPDFKTMTSYRMTDSLEYEELPKGGEIRHGTLGEESYTRSIKTYAKMLGLDRVDIINDDLSAFDDLRTRLGRGAARKFNNVFWTKFMANLATTFTTARGNYIAGATTNLGTDGVGLQQGVTKFRALESSDGKRIGGVAKILMVPPELEFTADRLFTGGNPGAQTVANTNPFAGKYRPVVVPWLSDSAFTGNSTTAWYLFREASILATMVVSFLNGQQTPTIESTDADFDTLGILFRGYHDFGADIAEYLAGVMSKGAA